MNFVTTVFLEFSDIFSTGRFVVLGDGAATVQNDFFVDIFAPVSAVCFGRLWRKDFGNVAQLSSPVGCSILSK